MQNITFTHVIVFVVKVRQGGMASRDDTPKPQKEFYWLEVISATGWRRSIYRLEELVGYWLESLGNDCDE